MAESPRPPKIQFLEARLRGHSGFELAKDQPQQFESHGRELKLGKRGAPTIPTIQIEILRDALRDYLQGAKRKPKATVECLKIVMDWAKGKGWKIGSKNALQRIIRPVYRDLWPKN
jgi:hypothetical protein